MELQVGVKAIARNNEGKYLLVKRSAVQYPDVQDAWDIVGGRIHSGTGLRENLLREIKEEVGLEFTGEPRLLGAQDIFPTAGNRHVVRLTYVIELNGNPVLDVRENTEYRWVSFEEFKSWPGLDIYVKKLLDQGIIS